METETTNATVEAGAAPDAEAHQGTPSTEPPKGGEKAALFQEGKPEGEPKEGEGDEKEPDDKPGEPPKGEDKTAPVTAEALKIPEGFQYDKESGDAFLGIVNDPGLSRQELVQKLVDMHAAQMGKMLQGLQAADAESVKQFEADLAKEKADWLDQCKADPEYGGAAWEANDAVIDRGCRQLATPEAVALLQRYNLNTHPEIVRMFYRAGKLAGEDKSGGGAPGGGKIDPAEAIFGESLRGVKGLNANG